MAQRYDTYASRTVGQIVHYIYYVCYMRACVIRMSSVDWTAVQYACMRCAQEREVGLGVSIYVVIMSVPVLYTQAPTKPDTSTLQLGKK